MEEPKTQKASTYNREKYEQNKEKILAYRKRRYRELNAYKYDIQIKEGIFILHFNQRMYVNIKPSTSQGKKMMAIFYDEAKKKVRTTHFGDVGYEDYTTHGDLQRKMNYLERHEKRENWNDYMTTGSLSRWILWNRPTLTASIDNYIGRFKLKKY